MVQLQHHALLLLLAFYGLCRQMLALVVTATCDSTYGIIRLLLLLRGTELLSLLSNTQFFCSS